MRASLPMYDLPEVRHATAAWWQGLARAFRAEGIADVPDRLDSVAGLYDHWRLPDLLFSQTCGYPLTHGIAGAVRLVAVNTAAEPFTGVVEAVLELPFESAEDGRWVDPELLDRSLPFVTRATTVLAVADDEGRPVPFQVLAAEEALAHLSSRFEPPWPVRACSTICPAPRSTPPSCRSPISARRSTSSACRPATTRRRSRGCRR